MLQFACSQLSTTADFFAYGCNCSLQKDDAADVQTVSDSIDMASDMISILSGGVINGRCMMTLLPFGDGGGCFPMTLYGPASPFAGFSAIPLRGPNSEIVSVTIDGANVAASAYRIVHHQGIDYLMRIDGEAWPSANSFDSSDSSNWSFTVRYGRGPDKITRDAVNELACELAEDFDGRKTMLPPGITSLNLQGASAQLEDMAEALRDGNENMPAVARFLGIYNPTGTRFRSGIYSPELSLGWELFVVTGPSGS